MIIRRARALEYLLENRTIFVRPSELLVGAISAVSRGVEAYPEYSVEIEPELDEGTMVSLEFMLPNSDEVLWARGTVMRETQRWGNDGLGVWFTILPGAYRRIIEDYVN